MYPSEKTRIGSTGWEDTEKTWCIDSPSSAEEGSNSLSSSRRWASSPLEAMKRQETIGVEGMTCWKKERSQGVKSEGMTCWKKARGHKRHLKASHGSHTQKHSNGTHTCTQTERHIYREAYTHVHTLTYTDTLKHSS